MKFLKILFIAVFSLALVGCFNKQSNKPQVNDKSSQSQANSGDAAQSEEKDLLSDGGITSLSQCKSIKDSKQKSDCVDNYNSYLAKKMGDVSYCDKISDATKRENCKTDFVVKNSMSKPKDCSDPDYAAQNDVCQNIDVSQKAFVKDDINICDSFSDSSKKGSCVYSFLSKKQTLVGACDKISDSQFKKICVDQSLYILASQKNDYNICSRISDTLTQTSCTKSIKMTSIVNSSSDNCDSLKDAANKQECKKANAVSSSNKSASSCDKLQGNDKKFCMDNYFFSNAVKTKDASLCDKISNANLKSGCKGYVK